METPEEILAALDEVDNYIILPRSILAVLPIREAVVLCWLRFRASRGWLATNHADLGHGIGLSADQTHRAMQRLEQIGVVESRSPDHMSRRREYRIAASTPQIRGMDTAEPRRPDTAETRRLPIEEDQEVEKKKDMAADAAALRPFDAFWERYPKSRRRERANCLAVYRKAVKGSAATATAVSVGLERWLAYWQAAQTEERFITTSIVWLRNRRWEDDPTLSAPSRQNGPVRPSLRNAPGSPLAQGATDRTGESGAW